MKNLLVLAVALLFGIAGSAAAQEKGYEKATSHSLKGYLVDQMCASGMVKKGTEAAMAKAAKHTKECALEDMCMESGYGVMSNGKYYKFDKNGDKEALALVKKTDSKSNIMIEVSGTGTNKEFKVASIKEIKADGVKADTRKKD